ncbi:hypothetical protein V6N13_115524 [Hibiscus sabdariffa]|uniref:Uncharacterized protein n=1 Tax=Hibiscus sabdariffa TaxID=183260 RepID=A0ABR2CS17_9ROSI
MISQYTSNTIRWQELERGRMPQVSPEVARPGSGMSSIIITEVLPGKQTRAWCQGDDTTSRQGQGETRIGEENVTMHTHKQQTQNNLYISSDKEKGDLSSLLLVPIVIFV